MRFQYFHYFSFTREDKLATHLVIQALKLFFLQSNK
mgnify:CR=1 FL=1